MKIYLIRHAKPYGIENLDLIEYNALDTYIKEGKLVGLKSEQNIPSTIPNIKNPLICCSEYRRAQESATLLGYKDFLIHHGANEIDMNLRELMSEEEYQKDLFIGFKKIMYEQFFLGGKGVESKKQVQERYTLLVTKLKEMSDGRDTIVFSHGFMMNLIRASY